MLLLGCGGSAPVSVSPPAPSGPAATLCGRLHERLPYSLGSGLEGRPTDPQSPYTAAWGDPPVTLRCGVNEPAGFVVGGPQPIGVDGVVWFFERRGGELRATTVDRIVAVEVDLPSGQNGELLVAFAPAISTALPGKTPLPRGAPG